MPVDWYTRLGDTKEAPKLLPQLGFSGIASFIPVTLPGIDVAQGIELDPKTPNDVQKLVQANRRKTELIAIRCANPEITRAATELREVDFILNPWAGREDSGLNHVLCKLARENNVAIVFDFAPILRSAKRKRALLLEQYQDAARAVAKAKAPFVLASGAEDPWELRSVSELSAFGESLGLPQPAIKQSFSGQRIRENRRKLTDRKWIASGIGIE